MKLRRASLWSAFAIAGAMFCFEEGGCLESVNSKAALDPGAGADGSAAGDGSSWAVCQSPSCDNANGTIPFLAQTPPIYLPDGAATADPCVDIQAQSGMILQTYCGQCHGPNTGAGQGGFNFVLNTSELLTTATTSTTFPHFIVPGTPSQSYLYVSMTTNQMPPPPVPGGPPTPIPSAADESVLYGWILACVSGADGGYANGGGNYGPDAGGNGGADGGGNNSTSQDASMSQTNTNDGGVP